MDGSQVINPYLTGNFAPVRSEDDFDLEIVGQIPAAISGAFYRNGPNPQFEPRGDYHWFGGDGMIHGFFVEGGKVAYRNRFVRTPKWELENSAGKAMFATFGNPMESDPSVFGKDSGVANTNIVWHAGHLLALEEGHKPFELDPIDPSVQGLRRPVSGQGHRPPQDRSGHRRDDLVRLHGRRHAVHQHGVLRRHRRLGRGGPPRRLRSAVLFHGARLPGHRPTRPVPHPAADRQPTAGHERAAAVRLGAGQGLARRGDGQERRRRDPALVRRRGLLRVPPDERLGRGRQDLRRRDGISDRAAVPQRRRQPRPGRQGAAGALDLRSGRIKSDTIKRTPLDDLGGEFPRFDERRACLSYRHGWFAGITRDQDQIRFDTIAHIDHTTGRRIDYTFPAGDSPGEPVFVPRSPDATEGDGWLVAVVYRATESRSDFVVFDAQDVAKGPIAVAKLPRRVPFGFHGNWRQA